MYSLMLESSHLPQNRDVLDIDLKFITVTLSPDCCVFLFQNHDQLIFNSRIDDITHTVC